MSVELRKIKVDSHVDFLKWSNSSTLKYGLFRKFCVENRMFPNFTTSYSIFNTLSIFANSLIS